MKTVSSNQYSVFGSIPLPGGVRGGFLVLCLLSALFASAQQTSQFTTPKFTEVTTDSVLVKCAGYEKVCLDVYGNGGEYATVRFYSTTGTALGNTIKIGAGKAYSQISDPLQTNGNFVVQLGTLTDWISATGDTFAPVIYCYCQK